MRFRELCSFQKLKVFHRPHEAQFLQATPAPDTRRSDATQPWSLRRRWRNDLVLLGSCRVPHVDKGYHKSALNLSASDNGEHIRCNFSSCAARTCSSGWEWARGDPSDGLGECHLTQGHVVSASQLAFSL